MAKTTTTTQAAPDDRLDGPIHTWFELTYANALVVDAARTRHLPADQQAELRAMLAELEAAFAHVPRAHRYLVLAAREWECGDLGGEQLARTGMSTNADSVHEDCEHGDEPQDDGSDDFAARHRAWADEVWNCERDNLHWYDWRGDEYDRHNRVMVPTESDEQAAAADRIVVHRAFLQSMPTAWQERFVALLDGLDQLDVDTPDSYEIVTFDAAGNRITDPAPHYNRGRTYVEPRIGA